MEHDIAVLGLGAYLHLGGPSAAWFERDHYLGTHGRFDCSVPTVCLSQVHIISTSLIREDKQKSEVRVNCPGSEPGPATLLLGVLTATLKRSVNV